MTDFAQRLAARSAGLPACLPLLMPRPASRFERSEFQTLEEVTEAAAPTAAKAVADPVSGRVHVPAAQPSQERRAEPPVTGTMDAADGMPAREPQQEKRSAAVTGDAVDPPLPIAASPSLGRVGVEASHREQADTAANGAARRIETSPKPRDEAAATHPPPIIARPDAAKAGQAMAPAISIGRIEVQFLSPEKPAAAPRPEPQRTRGFDAYARARRGMPR